MATNELSVMLTAKGNLENELKSARDRVKDLSKEIRTIQSTGGTVGDELAADFRQASIAAQKLGNEVNETNRKIKAAASQSSTAAAKIGRAWQKTAGIFSNNVVAGISAVTVALAGRQAINAYAQAEKMQLQLDIAFAKFPAVADASRASFDALNTAIMNMTGADDDALAASEGLLARFDLTGKQIQELIPLVNDYSIATGTELTASAETIGRALMGNARALKTLGINFKSTGDRAEDLDLLMAALEEKVGGVGEAFGQTTAGKMAIAQANFENLQEEIGAALVPALESVVAVIKPLSELFGGLADPVKKTGVAVTGLGIAAMIATPRIIAFNAALKTTGIVAGALGPLSAMFVGGAAATIQAYEAGEKFSKGQQTVAGTLRENDGLIGMVGLGWANLTSTIGKFRGETKDAIGVTKLAGMAMDALSADADGAADSINGVAAAHRNAATAANIRKRAEIGLAKGLARAENILARRRAVREYNSALEAFVKKPSKETGEAVIAAATAAAGAFKNPAKQAKFVKNAYEDIETAVANSGLPSDIQAKITSPLDVAYQKALALKSTLANLRVAESVTNAGANAVLRANGGPVWGPGTATSDSIPARLSNGEYVIRAGAVRALGLNTLHKLNRADKMTDPALLSKLAAGRGEPTPVEAGGPLIGAIHVHNPANGIDVEKAVIHGLARAERIKRERGV